MSKVIAKNPEGYKKLDNYRRTNLEVGPLRNLVHEELHGASRCMPTAYQGVGIGIEEAATETLARKRTRTRWRSVCRSTSRRSAATGT